MACNKCMYNNNNNRRRPARVARSAKMFSYVLFEKSIKSGFRFQVYTRLNYLKFEIPKILWGGAYRAPSPDPSPALSRASPSILASFSNLGRFAPLIRASPDSDPPTFEAWLRPCRPPICRMLKRSKLPTTRSVLSCRLQR